jgi:hypothetical protein
MSRSCISHVVAEQLPPPFLYLCTGAHVQRKVTISVKNKCVRPTSDADDASVLSGRDKSFAVNCTRELRCSCIHVRADVSVETRFTQ